VLKSKESVSKKKVSLLPNPLTLSYFSSGYFVQPRVEIPFERGGESQKMMAKVPIGFQHELGDIYSGIFVDDDILMHIKSLTVISKLKCKSNLLPFEIEYDIDDYAFQLGGKMHEIYEEVF